MIRMITLAVAALVLIAAAVFSQAPAPTAPAAAATTPPAAATTASAAPATGTNPAGGNAPAGAAARPGTAAATASAAPVAAAVPTMGTRASWLSDRRPLRVGDILTVTVAESAYASEQSTANASGNRSFDGQFNINTQSGVTSALIGPQKELATALNTASADEGDASRQGNLNAILAVKVTAIDPLGNAQIEGTKTVLIDGRQQDLKLSGLISGRRCHVRRSGLVHAHRQRDNQLQRQSHQATTGHHQQDPGDHMAMRVSQGWPRGLATLLLAVLLVGTLAPLAARAQSTRIGDLTVRAGDIPRRLVGYGLVVGLDGTGDRSYGGYTNQTPTVQSIVNLLEHFGVRVPTDEMQPRNVAAVAVTAEASPYLHAGGRFEVQVSLLGDAALLRGGVLWITPLVTDPNEPPVATAQGALLVTTGDDSRSSMNRRANTARVPEGGVLEVELPSPTPTGAPRLLLRDPDLETATRITTAVNAAFGPGTAAPEDPGAIALKVPAARADSLLQFLAAVDTLPVAWASPARIVIDARDGTVVTGGQVQVGPASVSHDGLTVQIGGTAAAAPAAPGAAQAPAAGGNAEAPPPAVLALNVGATVEDIAAGLHAAGATAPEIAAIFDGLRAVQALRAEVIVR